MLNKVPHSNFILKFSGTQVFPGASLKSIFIIRIQNSLLTYLPQEMYLDWFLYFSFCWLLEITQLFYYNFTNTKYIMYNKVRFCDPRLVRTCTYWPNSIRCNSRNKSYLKTQNRPTCTAVLMYRVAKFRWLRELETSWTW